MLVPTDAAHRLHEDKRRILDFHRVARQEVTGKEAPAAGEHLLPALLASFGAKHPHVRAQAAVSDSAAVIELVASGGIRIASRAGW